MLENVVRHHAQHYVLIKTTSYIAYSNPAIGILSSAVRNVVTEVNRYVTFIA